MNGSVNRDILDNLRALGEPGEPDPLIEFIDMFFADTPLVLQRLHQAVDAHNPTAVREAAHSLKGSSSNLGAEKLSHLCRDLESQGKAGALTSAPELLAQIEAEYAVVKELLEAERRASGG
jgi:HPt (histidine-containing phosphotransfer) domain-containing protein